MRNGETDWEEDSVSELGEFVLASIPKFSLL